MRKVVRSSSVDTRFYFWKVLELTDTVLPFRIKLNDGPSRHSFLLDLDSFDSDSVAFEQVLHPDSILSYSSDKLNGSS